MTICGLLCLFPTCSHSGVQQESAADSARIEVAASHDNLTTHLTRAMSWAEQARVQADAMDAAPRETLEYSIHSMQAEIGEALDLTGELRGVPLPGDAGEIEKRMAKITDGLREAEDFGRQSAQSLVKTDDRHRVEREVEQAIGAIEDAAIAHDEIVGFLSDPAYEFQLFAIVWPHHELASSYAAAIASLDRVVPRTTESGWVDLWRREIDWTDTEFERAEAAFGAIGSRLKRTSALHIPERLGPPVPQRLDSQLDAHLEAIREVHRTVRVYLELLESELAEPEPDALRLRHEAELALDQLRSAQSEHLALAAEEGIHLSAYEIGADSDA